MRVIADEHIANGLSDIESVQLAGDTVISRQILSTAMPRRFTHMARDIWTLQVRLKKTKKRATRVLMHPKFRAAYDFLLLRAQAGECLTEFVDYWTKEQLEEPLASKQKIKSGYHKPSSKRRPRKNTNKPPTDS